MTTKPNNQEYDGSTILKSVMQKGGSMTKKATKDSRRKIPWMDSYIVGGVRFREDDRKFRVLYTKHVILEEEFQNQLKQIKLESKMTEKLLYQISVLTGRLKAPECPKCGEPKKAGGILWLDHANCKRKAEVVKQ